MRIYAAFLFCVTLSCSLGASADQSPEVAFSPSPRAIELVERTINQAKQSIQVAAYSFTSYDIADALIEAQRRGVDVRVLLDMGQGKRHYKVIDSMRGVGIGIRINRHYAIMHNKYIITDGKTVETGSFNYTASANLHNAENVIVINDNEKLANEYMENWQKLWSEGEEYPQ